MTDLFEHYETLPQEVKDVIDEFEDMDSSYDNCNLFIERLNLVGYTCEYGLDGIPYNLSVLS